MTDAERRLWYHLRANRLQGIKFKRQKPLGSYIVDFVCLDKKLVIEVDGGQHQEQAAYDQERDAWLRREGFEVLRFWNTDVLKNMEGVLVTIMRAVQERTLSPDPSPTSVGGEKRISADPT
ncbi:MAG: DNA (cytosine-5-)-methyltransferase [Desulfobulbaceae bacterium A2]|nr:MAG: DNA (cytosine-5-)-methyltransferase [Desulfobulbaceae bacterium A2]